MSVNIHDLPNPAAFARLERIERLHVLRAAQAEWGLDDPRYRVLAGVHERRLMGRERPNA